MFQFIEIYVVIDVICLPHSNRVMLMRLNTNERKTDKIQIGNSTISLEPIESNEYHQKTENNNSYYLKNIVASV